MLAIDLGVFHRRPMRFRSKKPAFEAHMDWPGAGFQRRLLPVGQKALEF
jgi:hypothetical protein